MRDASEAVLSPAATSGALARAGWSEALAAKLRDEESHLTELKAARAAASTTAANPVRPIPHPTVISGYLENLRTLLETDPARGRDVLSRFVAPVVLTPNAEGPGRSYRATGAFNFSVLLSGAFSGSDTQTTREEQRIRSSTPAATSRRPHATSTRTP